MMMLLGWWEPLMYTAIFETTVSVSILAYLNKGKRLEYIFKGIIVTPIRYATILFDLVTMIRFARDIWLSKKQGWRK